MNIKLTIKVWLYKFGVLGVLVLGIDFFNLYDLAPKWLIIIVAVFIASILGKFLFIMFSGVSFYEVQFYEPEKNSVNGQWFIAQYDIPGGSGGSVVGYFDNYTNKTEEEFRLILYNQTRKSQIKKFAEWENTDEKLYSGSFEIKYNDLGKPLIVHLTSRAYI